MADTLYQLVIDWSNLFAIFFSRIRSDNALELRVLFCISRALCYLNLAMEGLMVRQSYSVVAAYKRSLGDINAALGIIQQISESLERSRPELLGALQPIRTRLMAMAEEEESLIVSIRSLIRNYGREG